MGVLIEGRPRFTPTICFDSFPLLRSPGQEPWWDARLNAITRATHALDETRHHWLNPPEADETTLKKWLLINLYNERRTWLVELHAALDRTVWSAYGWEDNPTQPSDETILERLLALNLERATNEK